MNTPQQNAVAKQAAQVAVESPVLGEPAAVNNEAVLAKAPAYNGPEQRKEQRRQARCRRDIIRYEVRKDDRRAHGRRATDSNPWLKYQG